MLKTLATPTKALMDSSQIAGAVHKGVDAFMEAVPPLMKILDEVAKIHPFIQGASPFFGIFAVALIVTYPMQLSLLRSRPYTHLRRNDMRMIRGF